LFALVGVTLFAVERMTETIQQSVLIDEAVIKGDVGDITLLIESVARCAKAGDAGGTGREGHI